MHRFVIGLLLMLIVTQLRADEFFASIRKIEDGEIFLAKTNLGKGKRGKKGRSAFESMPLAENVKVTAAKYKRKTQKFQVGISLAGGLKHDVFRNRSGSVTARIVTADQQVVEINVILNDADATTVIAVRPKRPPTKSTK